SRHPGCARRARPRAPCGRCRRESCRSGMARNGREVRSRERSCVHALYHRRPVNVSLSRRLPWEHARNRLTLALEERKARGLPTIDLTETNPTLVGLLYPEEELREILRRAAAAEYQPHPQGLAEAREA